jgi:hypothetical protein
LDDLFFGGIAGKLGEKSRFLGSGYENGNVGKKSKDGIFERGGETLRQAPSEIFGCETRHILVDEFFQG